MIFLLILAFCWKVSCAFSLWVLICWFAGIMEQYPLLFMSAKKISAAVKIFPFIWGPGHWSQVLPVQNVCKFCCTKQKKNVGLAGWQFKGAAVSTIRHITTQVDQLTSKAKRFACFKAFYWPMVNSQAFLLVDDTNQLSSITLAQTWPV